MRRLTRRLAATVVCAFGAAALVAAPGAALAAEPGIRINEVESSGGTPGDWIELFNNSSEPVMLDGYTVKDADDAHAYVLPAGSVVAPGAYLVLDEVIGDAGHFHFGLGGADRVRLFDPAGGLVDERAWTEHAATTWGVAPDGAWALTSAPTSGAENTFTASPAPEVVINEIIYDEISGHSDQVELYNAGSTPADLTGWRISDDKRDRFGDVPVGTVLAPGGFAVLVTDVHFGFGLGKNDEVVLYDASGAEIDSHAYVNTAPLAVWARCPDGTGAWTPATAASPGVANVCAPPAVVGSIRINEVDSQPADWVEFHNPGTEAADISGFEIRDNSDDHRWSFLPGTTLAGGAFLVVDENTVGTVGEGTAPFREPIGIGSADRIRLFDPRGTLVDDTEAWQGHAAIDGDAAAATLARCPDAQGPFVLAHPTPGAVNTCVPPTVAINEIESNGDATDWVEILNTGAAPVDLSGWTLMDNDPAGHAGETTPLPAGTVLEAGAYFVFDQPRDFVFGLGNGDTVTVRDTRGSTVAEHVYATHADGVWARCADGAGVFVDIPVPTKGLRNACGNPVRINEVESDGGDPDDWIELANPTASALDVAGIRVSDEDDTHAYVIPAGATIPAAGYLVIARAELGFGLGGGDMVRLFEGDELRDSTSWGAGHAATTWGRCPDASGTFAVTAEATPGAANLCAREVPRGVWPGSESVRALDENPMFLADSSGLDIQQTAEGTFLWAVDNGTGRFWKLAVAAGGSVAFADGWADGKRARFIADAADPRAAGPDAEGITVDGAGWLYLASERDNSAKGVNQNVVLKVDPAASGPDVVASQQWDLTAQLPAVSANLGMEAIEWIADSDLVGRLVDANTDAPYDPARYPLHGEGLFVVAMEDGGGLFAFALNTDGTAQLVATIDPGLPGVMGLDHDTVLGVLWAVCDDGCDGMAAQVTLNGTAEPGIAHVARPGAMPNVNNEGFATMPSVAAGATERAAWWFEDGVESGALRLGSVRVAGTPGTPGEPGEPGAPGGPATPGAPGTPGGPLPGAGVPTAPLPGSDLTPVNRGTLSAPASAVAGDRITIGAGAANAGRQVEVWMYSSPVRIAQGALDASGRISVVVPTGTAPGPHRLAVYADGELLGWRDILITGAGLAATGGTGAGGAALMGVMLALLGAAGIAVRRRTATR